MSLAKFPSFPPILNMGAAGHELPYWRLSSFYFFYFATLGALLPYWGLYLKSLGFGSGAIGALMAVLMVTKIIAPNIWSVIADRQRHRLAAVRWASGLAAIGFVGVWATTAFWALAISMALFSFFWNAALPQFEAITLNHLGRDADRYARIRLWGSIGFILTAMLLGWALDHASMQVIPLVVLLLMIGIWGASHLVPHNGRTRVASSPEPLSRVLRRPAVVALLAACFLMQLSHGPFYTFYSIYLEEYGHSAVTIGSLWGFGVLAEIVVFLFMHQLLRSFGAYRLFSYCFVLTTLRWLMVAFFPESLLLQLMAQSLHAASFGVYHAVAIQLFHAFFVGKLQGRGQALYSSLSFGAGGALGSIMSGMLWDWAGPANTYLIAAGVSTIGFIVAWRWIRDSEPARAVRHLERSAKGVVRDD
ncbi:MAG: MFS transporter [Gammaproteobacteria bacterium]